MKKLLSITCILLILISCSDNEVLDKKHKSLEQNHRELLQKTIAKNGEIKKYREQLNNISENVSAILLEESNLLEQMEKEPGIGQSSIGENLALISRVLDNQRYQIASVEEELKERDVDIGEYRKKLRQLDEFLVDRQNKITSFIDSLNNQNIELSIISQTLQESQFQNVSLTNELHQAWFAYGTFKELQEQDVVEKKGGILGIGAVKQLKTDFNPAYFMPLDTRETMEIPLLAEKANLVSSHPEGSYKWEGEEGISKLVIENPDEFWKLTKHLAIVVR